MHAISGRRDSTVGRPEDRTDGTVAKNPKTEDVSVGPVHSTFSRLRPNAITRPRMRPENLVGLGLYRPAPTLDGAETIRPVDFTIAAVVADVDLRVPVLFRQILV